MSRYYISIDLGGTNVRVASFNINSRRISQFIERKFVSYQSAEEEYRNNIVKLIDEIIVLNNDSELVGIGMSTASLFDRATGVIMEWPNHPKWRNMHLGGWLREYYKVPVAMEDDANSAALGEQLAGAAIDQKNFVYVTVSTGIGCGIVINDRLLTGEHGWAGEFGHIRVTDQNIKCNCGAIGCLQAVASGPAILKNYQQTEAYQRLKQKEEINVGDIVRLAYEGDADAIKVFYKAGNYIGKALGNLVLLLDVTFIILGGGVINAGEILISPINNGLKEIIGGRRKANIICSNLQNRNGIYGAISMIDQYINEKRTIEMGR